MMRRWTYESQEKDNTVTIVVYSRFRADAASQAMTKTFGRFEDLRLIKVEDMPPRLWRLGYRGKW